MGDDRIGERGVEEGKEDVGVDVGALGHGPRDNGDRGDEERVLEDPEIELVKVPQQHEVVVADEAVSVPKGKGVANKVKADGPHKGIQEILFPRRHEVLRGKQLRKVNRDLP